jgi:hypothetical protein
LVFFCSFLRVSSLKEVAIELPVSDLIGTELDPAVFTQILREYQNIVLTEFDDEVDFMLLCLQEGV